MRFKNQFSLFCKAYDATLLFFACNIYKSFKVILKAQFSHRYLILFFYIVLRILRKTCVKCKILQAYFTDI